MRKKKGTLARRWTLVGRFAAASVIAFVAIGVTLSMLLSRELLTQQQDAAENHAEFVTNSILRSELSAKDLAAPMPMRGDRYQAFLQFVSERILQYPLVLVTVWRSDGTVIFSSVPGLVGKKFPVGAGLRDAFTKGKTIGTISRASGRAALYPSDLPDKLLDAFVPVFGSIPHKSGPMVVVETFTDYSVVSGPVGRFFRSTLLSLSAGLLVLYMLMLPLAWRQAAKLDEQNERLEGALSRERTTQFQRRKLMERTLGAAEEERSRLAAELHDGPVQRLARLGYGLERVRTRQKQGDLKGSKELLQEIQTSVFDEVKDLRGMMSRLRPPVLDERGLEDALRDRADAMQEDAGISCSLEGHLEERLPPAIETVLYRVSQEALQNVIKHASAKNARIVLDRNNGSIIMEVRDDGVGFQPEAVPNASGQHFGMLAMRERVEVLGGTWSIESKPGHGTSVRVAVPWKRASS
jgi:signal transduction histidine kinase